jgi:arylsulfatase
LGCYGADDIKTPHIDKLAEEGARFTSFYSTQAVCSASRASLLTGCYANRLEMHNALMPNSKKGLNPDETTIASQLKKKGYQSAIYGKWHLGDHPDFFPMNYGFDDFYGILYSNDMWPNHPQQGPIFNFDDLLLYHNDEVIDTLYDQSELTTQLTEKAVKFIKDKKDNPFFLYLAHPQPHVPLFVSEDNDRDSQRGLYGDVIEEIDWSTGQIISALKEMDIYDNTIIIFTSDNGPWLAYGNHSGSAYPLREGKGTAWEGGQRVPFIVSYPHQLEAGLTIDDPAMGIDVLPTICAWTESGLPDKQIDGVSLIPYLDNSNIEKNLRPLFFYYRVNELHAIRYDKWKMYFPHRYRSLNGRPGGLDGIPANYEMNTLSEIELYDLDTDVEEKINVAGLHPDIISRLNEMADSMRSDLGDALTESTGKGVRPAANREW